MKFLFKKNFYIIPVVIFLTVIINSSSFFYFPLNYGWWQSYSYFENSGLILYKDINLVFPPLFIKLISSNVLNQFDSVVFSLIRIALFSYFLIHLLRKYFNTIEATFVCTLTLIVQAYSSVYISDDYHIFEKSIFIIYFYTIFIAFKNESNLFWQLCLGFISILMIYTKQNIGVLLYFAMITTFILEIFRTKKIIYIKNFIILIFGSLVSIIIMNYFFKFSLINLYDISINNDSKGNIYKIATNFLFVKNNSIQILFALILSIIFFSMPNIKKIGERKYSGISFLIIICLSLISIFSFIRMPFIVNITAITILIIGLVYYIQKKYIEYSRMAIFGIFYLYANSMTSDFSYENSIIIVAPLTPYLINFIFSSLKIKSKLKKIYLITFIVSILIMTLVEKVNKPYSWWGYTIPSIFNSKYEAPYEQLKGIKIDKYTLELLNLIKSNVNLYSKSIDDVYFYPHMPYFYFLHNKLPHSRNPVQWFDVISNKNMLEELDFIKNDLPNVVVMFDAPYSVYKGHQSMKGEIFQQNFPKLMDSLTYDNKYKLVEYKLWRNCSFIKLGLDDSDIKFIKTNFLTSNIIESDETIYSDINEFETNVTNNLIQIKKNEEVCNRLKIYVKTY